MLLHLLDRYSMQNELQLVWYIIDFLRSTFFDLLHFNNKLYATRLVYMFMSVVTDGFLNGIRLGVNAPFFATL